MTVKLGSMRLLRPAIVAVGMTTCVVPIADGTQPTSLLDRLVTILNTADQQAFLVFINANYAPSSLAEEDAEHRAAALARTFTDTGGFANTRIVSETSAEVLAEARARITDIPYCLRLHRVQQQNAELATDFTAHEMFPMGPPLRTPSPREVRDEVDALASRYAAQDLFSGVILIAHDQRIVLHKAYGQASVTPPVPMRIATRLSVASIAKMFTGVAIVIFRRNGATGFSAYRSQSIFGIKEPVPS